MSGIARRRAAALALHRQDRLGDAERAYRSVLADAGDDGETWHYLAVLCGQTARPQEALECCERALAAGYRSAAVHANLANALATLGRHGDSAEALAQAVIADPTDADLVLELAERRESLGDERGALAALDGASQRLVDAADIAAALGQLAVRLNRADTAVAAFRRAVALAPGSAPHWANLGSVLQMRGERNEAERAYRRALELAPDLYPCYWYLAQLRDIDAAGPLGQRIRTLAAAGEADAAVVFAAARVLAAAGDTGAAFRHYRRGNELVRRRFRYSVQRATGQIVALAERLADAMPSPASGPPGAVRPVPVFIVGMPRAGSTLIEQMLGRHPAIAAGGENPWLQRLVRDALQARGLDFPLDQGRLDAAELAAIRGAYLDSLRVRGGDAPFVTDKLPANYLCIPVLHRLFPGALIVHARRDPLETCWSCYKQLFAAPQDFAYDLSELAQYCRACLGFIERCRDASGRVVELPLARLLAAPERVLTRLLARLRLDWDPACLTPERASGLIVTASALQIREGLAARPRQDAAAYRAWLGPLIDGLGDLADNR